MKTILKTVLAGSVVMCLVPQGAGAFSLSAALGSGSRPVAQDSAARGDQKPVLVAQANDPAVRVGQLEEEVRKLTGQVQDLNYQLLQMQEQMRQMQKDNEFRFQRLEGGTSSAPQGGDGGNGDSGRSRNMTPPASSGSASSQGLPGVGDGATASTAPAAKGSGSPPQTLGTMTLDQSGKPVGLSMGTPGSNASGPDEASLPAGGSPDDIYRSAYNQVLNGNYKAAASGFRDYLDIYPDGPKAADATFWMGESEFSLGQFDRAAKTFLDAHQKYPKAEKAPETLLKLGMALAALNNQDTACATYREVLKRYPRASPSVRQKVASEEKRTGC